MQQSERGGLQSHFFGDCLIDRMMRRRYIEATGELLGEKEEALVVAGGALDTKNFERNVLKSLRYKDDGTVLVHKWVTEVPCDTSSTSKIKSVASST